MYPLATARGLLLVPHFILKVLYLSDTVADLLRCAYIKPAALSPLRSFPMGSWVWAVAAGAAILLVVEALLQLRRMFTPSTEVVHGSSDELSSPLTVGGTAGGVSGARSIQTPPLARWSWVRPLVLAPVWEEVLYRGLLLPALASCMPLWVAVVLSSLWFMLEHPGEGWPYVFLGVIVMSMAYCRTGNLVPAMVLHSLHNLYQYSGSASRH